MKRALVTLAAVMAVCGWATAQDLLIDFNSLTQDSGPHPQEGYQSYNAGHEVPADFVSVDYEAFGTEVTLTPSWPDSTDANTMQMIDRAPGNDANWLGDKVDLLTDWIGVDARTGNGGNGDFTLEAGGLFTRIDLTLTGVPAGSYNWISYHHDTENIHTDFFAELSLDGGVNFDAITDINGNNILSMTNSSPNSNPPADREYVGDDDADPLFLPSTLIFDFEKTNEDEMVIRFTPLAQVAVHTQLVGINGFELYRQEGVVITGDFDSNGLYECADINALYGALGGNDANFDLTADGAVDNADVVQWRTEAGSAKGFSGPINAGDADLNGIVDAGDLNVVGVNWQSQDAGSWCLGDFNHDGPVNASDLNDLGVNWLSDIRSAAAPASAAAVPEPSGFILVCFAAISIAIRRWRW